jgi:hypothetical protein
MYARSKLTKASALAMMVGLQEAAREMSVFASTR